MALVPPTTALLLADLTTMAVIPSLTLRPTIQLSACQLSVENSNQVSIAVRQRHLLTPRHSGFVLSP